MNPGEPGLLAYLSAIGAIATPVLVLALTGVGWTIRSRMERIQKLEGQLRDERVVIYNELLEPFFILLSPEPIFKGDPKFKGKNKDEVAIARFLSYEYRKNAFRMTLLAPDQVVQAYNNLMQFFYKTEGRALEIFEVQKAIRLLSQLLLEIRKSMGNEITKLTDVEMLEWLMKDISNLTAVPGQTNLIPNGISAIHSQSQL